MRQKNKYDLFLSLKKAIFSIVFLLFSILCSGQTVVRGRIVDTSHQGISQATVELNERKSKKIYTIVSDNNGWFILNNISIGIYQLNVTHINFVPQRQDSIVISEPNKNYTIPEITLITRSIMLDSVTIATKDRIEMRGDMLIFKPGSGLRTELLSFRELAQAVPIFFVDAKGGITINNRTPKILIDGKFSDLSNEEITSLLESIPALYITRIEIYLNPPLEYNSGGRPVVNVITLNRKVGLLGRLNSNASSNYNFSNSVNLTYKDSSNFLTGGYVINYTKIRSETSSNQLLYSNRHIDQFYNFTSNILRPLFRITIDKDISKKISGSAALFLTGNNYERNEDINTVWSAAVPDSSSSMDNTNSATGRGLSFYVQLKMKGLKDRLITKSSVTYNFSRVKNNTDYNERFTSYNTAFINDSVFRQWENSLVRIWTFRVSSSFNDPKAKIYFYSEFGLSLKNTDNDYGFDYLDELSGNYLKRLPFSGIFTYDHANTSVKLGVTKTVKSFKFTAGFSAEIFPFHFNSPDPARQFKGRYDILLPNIVIVYQKKNKPTVSLSYYKFGDIPAAYQLSPIISYGNPFSQAKGNFYLQPSLRQAIELSLSSNKSQYFFYGSIGINASKDIIEQFVEFVSGKNIYTYKNLGNMREYYTNLNFSKRISQALRLKTFIRYGISDYFKSGITEKSNLTSLIVSGSLTVNLENGLTVDLLSSYRNMTTFQNKNTSSVSYTLNAYKSFFKKRVLLNVSITNPFYRERLTQKTEGSGFSTSQTTLNNSSRFEISGTYNFIRPGRNLLRKARAENTDKPVLE